MSAGVCIINRNGIALAADSAGTYFGNKMFYNSSNKVFSLSGNHICGAIIYNRLYMYNVLIEQIMKEFRVYLDQEDRLDDFYDILLVFRRFVEENNVYYKFDQGEREECISLMKTLIDEWGGKIKAIIEEDDAEAKMDLILAELNDYIRTHVKVPDYDVSQHIKTNYADEYEKYLLSIVPEIESYPQKKEGLWSAISEYFNLSLVNEDKQFTGLLFAGYGEKDAFPKYLHISWSKVVGGQAKLIISEKYEGDTGAQIMPLAQDDVIYTFCKGISQSFIDSIPQNVQAAISSRIDSLPSTYTDDQKEELRNIMKMCKDDVARDIAAKIRSANIRPLINSVALIPLSEMAFLAENLVNMTTLKRTYSLDGNQQTVGGPTDVAVMSKGDGFVWIKKKTFGTVH